MSHIHNASFQFNINPPPPSGTSVNIQQTPVPLFNQGYNMLVEISTASAFLAPGTNAGITRNSIPVWAHFDTGARITTIDDSLANHLGLISTGASQIRTANGNATTNNYAVDISFINSKLKSIQNLQVSSCNLGGFNLQSCLQNKNDQTNFGVLIGRDIMSLWNITWHGPTSTVFVSD